MWREKKLVKAIASVAVPSLLLGLLAFQFQRYHNIINLRNPYVLEQLTATSDFVWNSLSGDTSFSQFKMEERHQEVPIENVPSFTVHYLWCIDGHFELNHYLTVMSAIYFFKPDELIIHYRMKPREDPEGYWRWLEDLQRDVIMLSLKPLKDASSCHYDLKKVGSDFSDHTGVFMLGDVVITNLSRSDIVHTVSRSVQEKSKFNVEEKEKINKHQFFVVSSIEPYQIMDIDEHVVLRCPSVTDAYNPKQPIPANCVSLNKYLHSEEILQLNTTFNRFVRKLLFGSENAAQGEKHALTQIPNTVHVILQDKETELTPLHYVSIKSAFLKGKLDCVYIHAPQEPFGEMWNRLRNEDNLNVKYVHAEAFAHVDVKHPYMMYALYNLLQHGGIFHFGDVVFVSPIPEETRSFAAIVSPHYSKYRLRHRSINTDIIAASRGSDFVKAMLAMVRQEKSTFPGVRVDDIASHIVEQIPESVVLDGRLTSHQVCQETLCELEGGHGPPHQAYTTRLRWQGKQPKSLDELKQVHGASRSDITAIIDA
ncbi:hypothetical protein PoB_002152600 [Plakobranchus ocellatus]|uniref:Glycosyltransferase family 92 protein n=1 Tax=Plakobranchus ocellatus TaxID=259542 RepID=A0AAV3ZKG5_9GAST|nr:hypothetical protein PoB_002152600 [Plakobranchus ocellatus]